jgi:hypothetical protein
MRRLSIGVALLGVVALGGCVESVDLGRPPAVASEPLDLRGTWTGTWGGAPARLVIAEQRELGDYAGLYVGPLQLLGRRRPGVSAVLTSTIAGVPVSTNADGWLGYANGRLTLYLRATTLSGAQVLTLTRTADDRWTGRGDSDFAWGPQGPIDLSRSRTPAS